MWPNLIALAGAIALGVAAVAGVLLFASRGQSPGTAAADEREGGRTPRAERKEAAPVRGDAKPAVRSGEVVSVSAETLHSAYLTNEPAAKARYEAGEVRVMGCLSAVRDVPGQRLWVVALTLPGIAPTHVANCLFAADPKSGVLQLAPYTFVTIIGRCRGLKGGVVLLDECELAPSPASTPPEDVLRTDAKTIWAAYRADAEKAHARYCGRVVEVSGCPIRFAAVKLLGLPSAYLFDEQLLRAEAAEQVKIQCHFTDPRELPDDDREPKTVRVRGRVGGGGLLPVLQECTLAK
jgi:hypothetical protein